MRYVLVVALLLSAGCTEEDSSVTLVGQNPFTGGNATADPGNLSQEPTTVMYETFELVNETVTIVANTCNPAGQTEDVMHTFDIVNGTTTFTATYARAEAPSSLFATNIRIYGPGNDAVGRPDEQSAWDGDGTMTFTFDAPAEGTWTARLLHCDVPDGQHQVDAVVTAEAPEGSY